jgi:hypothetical protein
VSLFYDFENITIAEKENYYRFKFIRVNHRSEGVKDVNHKPACLGRNSPKAGRQNRKDPTGRLTH